jgi:hypothetical protein
VETIETRTVCGRLDTPRNLVAGYRHFERRVVHSDCWIAAYENRRLPPSMKRAKRRAS